MNLFENIHDTQITRLFVPAGYSRNAPPRRPTRQSASEIARAAVREILG